MLLNECPWCSKPFHHDDYSGAAEWSEQCAHCDEEIWIVAHIDVDFEVKKRLQCAVEDCERLTYEDRKKCYQCWYKETYPENSKRIEGG